MRESNGQHVCTESQEVPVGISSPAPCCDGKFTEDDLNDEGNAFAQEYYEFETGQFVHDYAGTLGDDVPDLYHVADTWETFERIKPVLDQRFHEWKAKADPQQNGG